ncbi:Bax inhibitor-1/YccA family protein [Novosphingobium resinovorum]|uniref:Bax inhibitor-1/YccA family protein n=1 Tax=Novosphingobium resinovorum TaxID=158500 RepID=UPI002ED54C18|nr:Bax inhibitor-1/YccA family protein [Novosphingobium resinovorum]
MANWNDPQPRQGFGASPSRDLGRADGGTAYDAGLRRHMLSIYNYMASGVLLSGVVALLFAPYALAMMQSPVKWLVMLAPLGFVFAISGGASRFSEGTLKVLYWSFAAVMGVSLSTIFVVYTATSIATTFFATAAAFAGLSLYGYTTKKDLSGFGTFLIMGLVGILIASLVNLFVGSSVLQLVISILGVLIFAGLTAYDTQMLKNQYYHLRGTDFVGKAVVLGALSLYLDFINMFQFLLSFLGQRD